MLLNRTLGILRRRPRRLPIRWESSTVAPVWAIISGFNKFASRRDLGLVLGDVVPQKIETLLDAHSYFQGAWLLCLDPSEVHKIRSRISSTEAAEPGSASSSPGPLQASSSAPVPSMTDAPDKFTIRIISNYVPGGANNNNTTNLKDRGGQHIRLASELGITAATVRLRNVRYNLGLDAIKFFLREFDLGPLGIQKMTTDPKLNQYLIHFSKPSEAENAMHSLNLKVASGNVMHLYWYTQCL